MCRAMGTVSRDGCEGDEVGLSLDWLITRKKAILEHKGKRMYKMRFKIWAFKAMARSLGFVFILIRLY